MKRLVCVVDRNGVTHEVPMRAEEADFFLKLTELKARENPSITFHDVVTMWIEKMEREQKERGDSSALAN
ncbi:MAG TPA: hypothetical protein VKT82_06415 [Ktedonobacterales bacterium]|nr:hypothetical protein [Ktedonobacterales bacterium]